jgi:hypothetical protein
VSIIAPRVVRSVLDEVSVIGYGEKGGASCLSVWRFSRECVMYEYVPPRYPSEQCQQDFKFPPSWTRE